MRKILTALLIVVSSLSAITTADVFRTHLRRVFIETGSYLGDGIQNALDAGFEEIHSIELSPYYYLHCKKRFEGNPHVHLYLGDSSILLEKVLKTIQEPVTFWLDGHYSWGNTARGKTNTPLISELEIISRHPLKTHTLLIDDVRQFGQEEFDFIPLNFIVEMILEINPNYTIYFQDGFQKDDVLVAEIL